MTFHPSSAWMLFLLPLAALALLRVLRPRARATVSFSSLGAIGQVPAGRWTRVRHLPQVLRVIALALLVVCLARPVVSNESQRTLVEGVAIELIVDRSDSMRALDFSVDGKPANRLDALKDMARKFVAGGEGFAGRANDLVGVIAFARNADSVVPLTLDHGVVLDALAQIRFPEGGDEMGTAIGDAVALGVEKLKDAADRANQGGATRIKSKVLVLFTDGESNAGELTPEEASALAASTGVKLYAVGMGTKGTAPFPVRTPLGTRIQQVPVSIDEKTLTEISTATGGRYFRATDSESLREIYATIDALEKSSIEEPKLVRYRDLAVESSADAGLRNWSLPPLLAIVLSLLLLETLVVTTRWRTIA